MPWASNAPEDVERVLAKRPAIGVGVEDVSMGEEKLQRQRYEHPDHPDCRGVPCLRQDIDVDEDGCWAPFEAVRPEGFSLLHGSGGVVNRDIPPC